MISLFRSYSTLHSAFTRRQAAADLSRDLAQAQQELSTGFKSDVFSSLGVRTSEALDLRASASRHEAQILANSLLMGRMESMDDALGTIRDAVQTTLELAVPNRDAPLGTVTEVQSAAKTALETLVAQANGTHAGVPLFAGTEQPARVLQGWTEANPATGLSPRDVMDGILAGGLPDAAAASAAIAEIEAAFANASATPARNFDATFYNGSPAGSARQTAVIGEGDTIDYGVQANDAAFRDTMMGLAMLAAVDPASMDPGAYEVWMGRAVDALAGGEAGLLEAQTNVGAQQARIETANTRMQDRVDLYKSRILDLEGVDEYEAATRITQLDNQLNASYAVTARLSQLSFLNYM
ncbi:flagellin [Pseudooceanicola sp.]|uniref:flagellin n=1 Tax=Pseudooceanicola sp. TaxID=1914328 RepID=UPI00405972A5